MVVPSSTAALLASAFILFAGAPTHGQTAIPDADRFIKLGTRIAPLRAGEGGQLTLTAPAALCTDARHLLEVRFFPNPGREMPVVRMFTGPSPCRWDFDAMAAGYYAAIIQEADDGRAVGQYPASSPSRRINSMAPLWLWTNGTHRQTSAPT